MGTAMIETERPTNGEKVRDRDSVMPVENITMGTGRVASS
jgi:hypothetical protein